MCLEAKRGTMRAEKGLATHYTGEPLCAKVSAKTHQRSELITSNEESLVTSAGQNAFVRIQTYFILSIY